MKKVKKKRRRKREKNNGKSNNKKEKINEEPTSSPKGYKNEIKELKNDDDLLKSNMNKKKIFQILIEDIINFLEENIIDIEIHNKSDTLILKDTLKQFKSNANGLIFNRFNKRR